MLRKGAVEALLIEEIAGLQRSKASAADRREELARSRRRAMIMAVLDWAAILVLFLFRDPLAEFLPLGGTERSVFTLAILVVATHAGFRLGHFERLRAIERAIGDLDRFC